MINQDELVKELDRLREENKKLKEELDICRLKENLENKKEDSYKSFFQNAPLGMFRSTPEGKFIEVNRALAKMLGYESPGEVLEKIEKIERDVYVKTEKRKEIVHEILNSHGIVHFENVYKRKNGEHFVANLYLKHIKDLEDNNIYLEGIVEEITDRKKEEEIIKEREASIRAKLDAILLPDIESDSLRFSDIIDVPAVQDLMDHFFSLTQIGIGILDINGEIVVSRGWQDICTKFHRVNSETCKNCIESDTILSESVKEGTFKLYRCRNNMWDMVTPIIVGGRHMANLFLGQFLFEGEEPDCEVFRLQALKYGFDEKEYISALERVPRWSRKTVNLVMNFYTRFANLISVLSYSNLKLARTIVENKKKENILRKSEETFRSYIENAPDGIFLADEKGNYILVNNSAILMTGFSKKELLEKNFIDITFSGDIPLAENHFKDLLEYGESSGEMRFVTKAGEIRYWIVKAVKLSDNRFLAFTSDITEQKMSEEILKETTKRLELATKSGKLGVWEWNISSNILIWDDRMFEIYGVEKSLFRNCVDAWYKGLHPEDAKDAIEFCHAVSRGEREFDTEFRIVTPLGEVKYIKANALVIRDDNGKELKMIGLNRDITEEKWMEKSLVESREDLKKAQSLSRIGSWHYHIESDKPQWSDEMFVIFARDPALKEPSWKEHSSIIHSDDWNFVNDTVIKAMKNGDPYNMEFRIVHNDGKIVWGNSIGEPVIDANGKIVALHGTVQDITLRKNLEIEKNKLQGQLLQAQKMEAIGTLAGGIAHDFNNILGSLIGYTELSLDCVEDGMSKDFLGQILHACYRAKDLVAQILAFSRRKEPEKKSVKVSIIINEVIKFMRASIPSTIEIIQNIHSPESLIFADPGQIHQILVNLCTNAYHAMKNTGGIMEVSLFKSDTNMSYQDMEPGDYVIITVKDTGCGMEKDILERIFEPYFTTKDVGEGTGLGLAVVHGIVESHGGYVKVSSEPVKGTIFYIFLHEIKSCVFEKNELSKKLPSGKEHILIVDDEQSLIAIMKRMLEKFGYKVTTASGSKEALMVFKKEPSSYDLVVTDKTMPFMTGIDLAKEIAKIREDIPVILCTGFENKADNEVLHASMIKKIIIKPVTQQILLESVREVLDGIKSF